MSEKKKNWQQNQQEKMDKYDIKLGDIDPKELLRDIKIELDILLCHLDVLRSTVSSEEVDRKVDSIFLQVDKAYDSITTILENSADDDLKNRYQERELL